MKKTVFAIFSLLAGCLPAQDFAKDLEQVYKHFVNAERISYAIKYSLRAGHQENSRLIMESPGRYCRNKQSHLSVFENKTTLVTGSEIVMIDRAEKRIQVKKTDGTSSGVPDAVSILKTFSNYVHKINRIPSGKNQAIYDVYLKPGSEQPIDHYRIVLNTGSYYLESISLFYKTGLRRNEDYQVTGKEIPRLDISFYDFNSPQTNVSEETRADYYYNKTSNKLSPTLNFKGYAVKEVF